MLTYDEVMAKDGFYSVKLQSVETGEVKIVKGDWWSPGSFAMWTEGSMACDCNREYKFGNSGPGRKCGRTRFKLLAIIFEYGSEYIFEETKID